MFAQLGLPQMSVSCMCILFVLTTGRSDLVMDLPVVPGDREPCHRALGTRTLGVLK
jgi:hypothetical protein